MTSSKLYLGYRQLERSLMSKHLTMRDRVIVQYEIEHNHHSLPENYL